MLVNKQSKIVILGIAALVLIAALIALALQVHARTVAYSMTPAQGNRLMGTVTAVDPSASTVTVQTRDGKTVVATTSPATVVTTMTMESVTDLKNGDLVEVGAGRDDIPTATAITASRIRVLDALPASGQTRPHSMVGTIASTSPSLTMTTADGTSVAVTADDRTRVFGSTPATLSAVTVGSRVEVHGQPGANGFAADHIAVMPAFRRPGGMQNG